MKTATFLSLLVAMTMAATASANVYKCISDDGVVTFSDRPCGQQAEVVFKDTKISVDEAIGTGRPYEQPLEESADIRYEILRHARAVGHSIFPEKRLDAHDVSTEHTGNLRKWIVFLSYTTPQKEHLWARVRLDYAGTLKDRKVLAQLKYIAIKRFDWATPLKTMKKQKKVKKDAHYGWHVIPQPE